MTLTREQIEALLDGAKQPSDLSRNPSRKGQHDLMAAAPALAAVTPPAAQEGATPCPHSDLYDKGECCGGLCHKQDAAAQEGGA